PRAVPSLPTRRSSDLDRPAEGRFPSEWARLRCDRRERLLKNTVRVWIVLQGHLSPVAMLVKGLIFQVREGFLKIPIIDRAEVMGDRKSTRLNSSHRTI